MQALWPVIEASVPRLGPLDICTVLQCFVHLRQPPKRSCLEALLASFASQMSAGMINTSGAGSQALNAQQQGIKQKYIVSGSPAAPVNGTAPSGGYSSIGDGQRPVTISPGILANVLWSLSGIGYQPSQSWVRAYESALDVSVGLLTADQLSKLMRAAAQLHLQLQPATCRKLEQALIGQIGTCSSEVLLQLCQAAAQEASRAGDARSNQQVGPPPSPAAAHIESSKSPAWAAMSKTETQPGLFSRPLVIQLAERLVAVVEDLSLDQSACALNCLADIIAACRSGGSKSTKRQSEFERLKEVAHGFAVAAAKCALPRLQASAPRSSPSAPETTPTSDYPSAEETSVAADLGSSSGISDQLGGLPALCSALCRLRVRPSARWVNAALAHHERKLGHADSLSLTHMLSALSHWQCRPPQRFMQKYFYRSCSILHSYSPANLVITARSMAALKARTHGTWMEAFCSVVGIKYAEISTNGQASLAASIATIMQNEAAAAGIWPSRSSSAGGQWGAGRRTAGEGRGRRRSGRRAEPGQSERMLQVAGETLRELLFQVRL